MNHEIAHPIHEPNSPPPKTIIKVPNHFTHEFISGTAGGIVGTLIGYPLDTIKVRLQTVGHLYNNNAINCTKNIFQKEGLFAFYRGMLSPMYGEAANCCFSFGIFGFLKRFQEMYNYNLWSITASGAFSGLACTVILAPTDLIKIRLQSYVANNTNTYAFQRPVGYRGFWDCASTVFKTGGIRSLFCGWSATALRDVPFNATWFSVNHLILQYLNSKRDNFTLLQNATVPAILAGGLAGMASWLVAFPLDSIKSIIQSSVKFETNILPDKSTQTRIVQRKIIDVVREELARNGSIRVFYNGFGTAIVRSFPVNAAMYVGYDFVFNRLQE